MTIHQKKYKKWAKMKSIIEKFHWWFAGNPRDIFWTNIGTNIGNEACWHGDGWIRPVLVIKRYGNLHLVVPMTTHWLYEDQGTWLIKKYHHKITSLDFGRKSYLMMNQLQTIDRKRFTKKVYDKNGKYAQLWVDAFIYIKNQIRKQMKTN